jgi:hypothetical protein
MKKNAVCVTMTTRDLPSRLPKGFHYKLPRHAGVSYRVPVPPPRPPRQR